MDEYRSNKSDDNVNESEEFYDVGSVEGRNVDPVYVDRKSVV